MYIDQSIYDVKRGEQDKHNCSTLAVEKWSSLEHICCNRHLHSPDSAYATEFMRKGTTTKTISKVIFITYKTAERSQTGDRGFSIFKCRIQNTTYCRCFTFQWRIYHVELNFSLARAESRPSQTNRTTRNTLNALSAGKHDGFRRRLLLSHGSLIL